MRRVTFSRNLTLSLSRPCRCYCKYCAFATHRAHLYTPEEVERMLDDAARRNVKELLVLTGERPEVNPDVAARLREHGHRDFTSYVAWTCERALERGMLPHTNLGVLSPDDLARLREVTAPQGLMLESISERLMETVHAGSPTKHPARRLETIHAAGELRIPFTSGILVGIGETEDERIASLEALAAAHHRHGHIQEVILQNFVPHQSYYGREPAQIADGAAREYWRTGVADGPSLARPDWACPVSVDDMRRLVRECRRLMPEVGVQVPPNLSDWWLDLVREGATDLGGLSANGDHISPEHPFPSPHQVRRRLAAEGFALTERLCVYPQFIDSDWLTQGVLDVIKRRYWSFIPRRGSGRRQDRPIRADLVPAAVERGRNGRRLSAEELTALFAERRQEAVDFGATEICMQSGIHPEWALEDYEHWLRVAKQVAPELHLHAYSPMEVAHMCDMSGLAPIAVFERLRDAGLDSTPGTAAEVLHDGVRERISPNKLPVARWVEVIEASHAAGLRSTVTVMFGHIEEPWELAEHMRVVRDLQERTGGFTEFVPLSFIPFHTLLGRTHGIEEISREENLKHTAVFRLALGRTVRNLQASWVKMGLDAATESLRWGVNDLGGTLMEESISRMAGSYHGVRLTAEDLIAAAQAADRPVVQRDTLYRVLQTY